MRGQTIVQQGFALSLHLHIPCTKRMKLCAQKRLHSVACINDVAGLFMHISIHYHLNVRVSSNGLKYFDIRSFDCYMGEMTVPENIELFLQTMHIYEGDNHVVVEVYI